MPLQAIVAIELRQGVRFVGAICGATPSGLVVQPSVCPCLCCMVKYVCDLSESVVEILLDAKSGVYKFPSLSTIDWKMWKEVQLFNITHLILA